MRTKHIHLISHFVFALSLFVCLVVSACSAVGAPATQATPTGGIPAFAAKLQPLLGAKMQQLHTPGAIIYVDDPGQGSWTTTLGTSDLATKAPMNVNSHMRIGSITKTFTATVILQLVDEGKLRLDDPVAKYLPQVPNGANITIRELLNMTSGLFNYSNDQGFQQALVADPGMDGSSLPPRTSSAIPDPHPYGYALAETLGRTGAPLNVTGWSPSWGWAAGSAISTLHDLKIWAKALATGQLLSAATQKERLSWVPFVGGSWIGHDTVAYGLGVADFGGVIGHNGDLPGFQSFMGYLPQKGAMIVVLTNLYFAPDGSGPADDLEKVIQKELFA